MKKLYLTGVSAKVNQFNLALLLTHVLRFCGRIMVICERCFSFRVFINTGLWQRAEFHLCWRYG